MVKILIFFNWYFQCHIRNPTTKIPKCEKLLIVRRFLEILNFEKISRLNQPRAARLLLKILVSIFLSQRMSNSGILPKNFYMNFYLSIENYYIQI